MRLEDKEFLGYLGLLDIATIFAITCGWLFFVSLCVWTFQEKYDSDEYDDGKMTLITSGVSMMRYIFHIFSAILAINVIASMILLRGVWMLADGRPNGNRLPNQDDVWRAWQAVWEVGRYLLIYIVLNVIETVVAYRGWRYSAKKLPSMLLLIKTGTLMKKKWNSIMSEVSSEV